MEDTSKIVKTNGHVDVKTEALVLQIVAGSYERILHGINATISLEQKPSVQFADSFLFNAHASAIKCLALSPLPDRNSTESQGVYLATGGSDERVNVYSLSASPLQEDKRMPAMPSLGGSKIAEDIRNREVGSILQHSSNITALHFPTRSKLLSSAEDNTVAVSRVKDLTVVSTVKAPRPKVQGQPTGDTSPAGSTPVGVNDFAVHPSMKLMVSVSKGERCMRLWNLVTGKKAGVLNFGRESLQSIKESKYSSGEGRRIRWNHSGSEFAVAFERGVIIYGQDSRPKCRIFPQPLTKIHQVHYVNPMEGDCDILAVSTEDGRILFYDTTTVLPTTKTGLEQTGTLPDALLTSELGGKAVGIAGRVKDFVVLMLNEKSSDKELAIITASSDGIIRIWLSTIEEIVQNKEKPKQIGTLIGTHETGSRITCLGAFVMLPAIPSTEIESEVEGLEAETSDEGSTSDSDG